MTDKLAWTHEQRFRAVQVMAAYAAKRMEDGAKYGTPGVPNLASVKLACSASSEALDASLDELRSMAAAVNVEPPT